MPITKLRKQRVKAERLKMYNYMVFNVSEKKLYNDFLSYYKRNPCDDFYFVSIDNPEFLEYLEEFLERRLN